MHSNVHNSIIYDSHVKEWKISIYNTKWNESSRER